MTSREQHPQSIVLDALPYVEPLDPHYEQTAISLIEAELASAMDEGTHPSMTPLPPHGDGIANAPLATEMYQSLHQRQQDASTVEWDSLQSSTNPQTVSELESAIHSSKLQFEHQRLQLTNLELHSILTSSETYQMYHSQLTNQYVDPQQQLLSEQKIKVDGINARRMEEQKESMKKLLQLRQRWEGLMEKNGRLDRHIAVLEKEVEGLKGEIGGEVVGGGEGTGEH